MQDFNNVNLKWLCLWTCNSKGDCRVHLFFLAFNELMAGNNDSEKKDKDFSDFSSFATLFATHAGLQTLCLGGGGGGGEAE